MGSAGHWVIESCLNRWIDPNGGSPKCAEWIGQVDPDGTVIDEEMALGAQTCVDHVLQVCQARGGLRSLWIEKHVSMPQIHALNNGTLDLALVAPQGYPEIHLWDAKFGHIDVAAFENWQEINYTAGIVNELGITGADDINWTVHMYIVQPFSYSPEGPIKTWTVNLADLRGYFNRLRMAAEKAIDSTTLTPGPHCHRCPRVGSCPAARKAVYSMAHYADQPFDIDQLTVEDMAAERDILETIGKIIKGRTSDIEAMLMHELKQGNSGETGLAVEASSGNLKWKIPPDQVLALGKQFGINAAKEGVITPTQFKDAASAEMRDAVNQTINTIAHRPPGGLKIIEAGNSLAARAFRRK